VDIAVIVDEVDIAAQVVIVAIVGLKGSVALVGIVVQQELQLR
jgi:hypothetical protein